MKKYNLFFILLISFALLVIGLKTSASTLSLSPATGSHNVNDNFSVDIYVNTAGQNADTVAAYLNYNSTNFQVTGIDTTGSLFTMQAENDYSTAGKIKITRGIPAPSVVNNSNGFVAKVNFKAISAVSPTTDNITFDFVAGDANRSNVLLAGNPSLTSVTNGRHTIAGTGDTQTPTVTAFTIPSTSNSLTISISTLTATDNVAVTGYLVNESATPPSASASGWSAAKPTSYTFSSAGAKTLYAWAKDAAGNVSASLSASVTVTVANDTQAPTVMVFVIPSTSNSLSVSVSFTATDNIAVTGYMLTESAAAPSASASGWSGAAPLIYQFSTAGSKTLYAWAKDAAGNVSASKSASVTITISQTLSVTLTANPSSGTAPLNAVDLSASVSGTATGNINYTFYCNRSDSGTNITTSYQGKYDGQSQSTYNAVDICSYSQPGTYTAKVIIERGSYQAEARTSIVVNAGTPTPTPTQNSLPVGHLDVADANHVSGWAFDKDAGTSAVSVHIYIDGVHTGTIDANLSRNDLIGAIGGTIQDPNHGFSYNYPSALANGNHTIRVYAINVPQGTNPELGGSPKIISVGTTPTPTPSPGPVTNGSLVRSSDDTKVYLIENNQKRWIPSLDVFMSNGYSWNNVTVVSPDVLAGYTEGAAVEAGVVIPSLHANATLMKISGDPKVFALVGTKLRWIANPTIFALYKYQWNNVKLVSATEINKYTKTGLVRAVGDAKVYYINARGQKKWIVNETIFNAYNNRWENVLEVLKAEVDSYPLVNLVRAQGDTKVYLLEGTIKRWIKTAEIFQQKGYKWDEVDVVNQAEITAYQEGADIE